MNVIDEKYMRDALECAAMALNSGLLPVGAVCVYDGKIISRGMPNRYMPPELSCAGYDVCYKTLVGRCSSGNLSGVTLYITSEPSIMCVSLCIEACISRIVYGVADSFGGGICLIREAQRSCQKFTQQVPSFEGGCLTEESELLFRRFFKVYKESRQNLPENISARLGDNVHVLRNQ